MWAAALVLIAAGFVGWRAIDTGVHTQPDPVQRGSAGGATASTAPVIPAAGSAQRVVEVRALQQGWLEARGPDGTVFLSRTL
jgi:hypothetical protein